MKQKLKFMKGPRFRHSLLSRYVFIILFALLFLPIVFPLVSVVYLIAETNIFDREPAGLKYGNAAQIEAMWHQEAAMLGEAGAEQIDGKLLEMKERYPEASFFWVDEEGRTQRQISISDLPRLPVLWTHADAIRFMKANVDSDPFTVVAFIGKDNQGPSFMVLQLPRSLLQTTLPFNQGSPLYIIFVFLLFALFAMMSLMFFRHIRKRLLRLQSAMMLHDRDGLPKPIELKKQDEIGQLEASFNQMVNQLQESHERQREEEALRKRLISNLSHDLRTPLTVMNSHIYHLRNEELSELGRESIKQLSYKIEGLSSLIENLLSYTLMTSGRYELKLEQIDVLRLVRESAAAWYPLWEKEGIEAEVQLPEQALMWNVDKEGLRRILDNLFQNVVRHAANGQYIGVTVDEWKDGTALVIADHGEGMNASSMGKGAGIGLAIVDYLIREMGLDWQIDSSDKGTRIIIYPQPSSGTILNKI